jgi:acyl dehydratase
MAETVKAEDLPKLVGTDLDPSQWIEVTQERVNQFAEATNDFQFIHVDPEKAAQTPFGGPIAHGFLSLSLLSFLNAQTAITVEIEGEETPALVAEILSMMVVA